MNSQIDANNLVIEEREREITLTRGVDEINTLMRDVHQMTLLQRPMIDSIEETIERTLEETKEAEKELRSASEHQ
ncbi:hypothetical protein HMI54_009674, partial [Coelomomyces lativittatus]